MMSLFFVVACGSADPPAVRAANDANAKSVAAPSAGMSRIVLVRPDSSCDTATYPIIVDENGHFVAQLSQNSQLSIEMPPGDHTLFAWPNIDPRVEKLPNFDPVGIEKLHLEAGQTKYVVAFIPRGRSLRCPRFTIFGLRQAKEEEPDLEREIAAAKTITIDRSAGEAELAKDPAVVQAHLESGRRELERREARRDGREREGEGEEFSPSDPKDSTDTKSAVTPQ